MPVLSRVGWAAGIERLVMLIADAPQPVRPIAIVPLGPAAERQAITLAAKLRRHGMAIELGFSGNMGKRMKRADKLGARAAIIMGEDELARAMVTLRDLDAGTQQEVALDGLEDVLAQMR